MTQAAMASHTSVTDFLMLPIGLFFDIYEEIAEILKARSEK